MELHRRIRGGDQDARRLFRTLAPRLGSVASVLYRELFGEELVEEKCYICGSSLSDGVRAAAERAIEELRFTDVSGFLVAARVPEDVRSREDEVKINLGLEYSEAIGSEVKREVSKLIQRALPLRPDFDSPDVIVEVDVAEWNTRLVFMPLLVKGRYWKIGRRISQSIWVTGAGERRYPFSVEDGLALLSEVFDGKDSILHGAGREDADVRMLGTGRPFVAEVKEARRRSLALNVVEAEVNRYTRGLVEYKFERRARRSDVAAVKGVDGKHDKVYKALVVAEDSVSNTELKHLEDFFRMRTVKQRTPKRVRHRRPDVVRERIVYSVATRRLGERVFEALIYTEGGLYIKELVSGDGGDTSPSFAEVLGRRAYCAELDVVAVLAGRAERL
jgi:tRNA pseudouridine synthase 10